MSERAQRIRQSKLANQKIICEEEAEGLFNWILDLLESSDETKLRVVVTADGRASCWGEDFGKIDIHALAVCAGLFYSEPGYTMTFYSEKMIGGGAWLDVGIEM